MSAKADTYFADEIVCKDSNNWKFTVRAKGNLVMTVELFAKVGLVHKSCDLYIRDNSTFVLEAC